jgi:hypothetical protein
VTTSFGFPFRLGYESVITLDVFQHHNYNSSLSNGAEFVTSFICEHREGEEEVIETDRP